MGDEDSACSALNWLISGKFYFTFFINIVGLILRVCCEFSLRSATTSRDRFYWILSMSVALYDPDRTLSGVFRIFSCISASEAFSSMLLSEDSDSEESVMPALGVWVDFCMSFIISWLVLGLFIDLCVDESTGGKRSWSLVESSSIEGSSIIPSAWYFNFYLLNFLKLPRLLSLTDYFFEGGEFACPARMEYFKSGLGLKSTNWDRVRNILNDYLNFN